MKYLDFQNQKTLSNEIYKIIIIVGRMIQEKNDLLKSIKDLEEQLMNIKPEGNEKIYSSGGNSSEYFKRICKDVMANIEVMFYEKKDAFFGFCL